MSLNKISLPAVLKQGKLFLKDRGIDTFSLDAEVLLMFVTGFDRVQLLIRDTLTEDEALRYEALLKKRGEFMPVSYIVGHREFMSLPFVVNEHTLIPRQDTEILAETAIRFIKECGFKNILELCTGSGCISVALAHFCDDVDIVAADISEKALEVAVQNAENNNVSDKIKFIKSDIFDGIERKFDVIISNPPYIETNRIEDLPVQVKRFEPFIALDGGEDGLKFYRIIAKTASRYLTEGGMIFFEIGYNQMLEVRRILRDAGFADVEIERDLAGLNRVVYGRNMHV